MCDGISWATPRKSMLELICSEVNNFLTIRHHVRPASSARGALQRREAYCLPVRRFHDGTAPARREHLRCGALRDMAGERTTSAPASSARARAPGAGRHAGRRRGTASRRGSSRATAAEAAEAARLLAAWPGHSDAAADAYVAAFAAGLPRASWPEVIEALRRARRGREADRVANFLQSPEHLTRYTAP
jgi:hypothetical protein